MQEGEKRAPQPYRVTITLIYIAVLNLESMHKLKNVKTIMIHSAVDRAHWEFAKVHKYM